jgi:hypothetical protein
LFVKFPSDKACKHHRQAQDFLMRRTFQFMLLLALPLWACGCATHQLWCGSGFDEWNEPAPNPNLRLFDDRRRNDLLVVYNEYSERYASTNTRAFYLETNQKRIAQGSSPRFAALNASRGLPPVPVFCPAPAFPPGRLYAITQTNHSGFTLFSDGQEISSYELPVYTDSVGRRAKIALTPVAATIDLAIIGSVAGCCWLYMDAPGWNH